MRFPSVALLNDKEFRSLRRATNAARVGSAVAFAAKSDVKAFRSLRALPISNSPINQNLKAYNLFHTRATARGESKMIRSKKHGKIIAAFLLFLCTTLILSMSVSVFEIDISAADNETRAALICETSRTGEGEIEVILRLFEGKLCALAATLEYNSDRFYFVDAKIEDTLAEGAGEFVLSYVCDDKNVKFIIDGVENAESGAIIARFYFKARREGAFALEFCLRGADGVSAVALDGNGKIVSAGADFSRAAGKIYTASSEKMPILAKKPTLMSVSIEWEAGNSQAELVLPISADKNCFALEVRVFVLDLTTGKSEICCFAARYGRFCLPVSVSGRLCAVVTPLAYQGNRTVEGDKTALVINNGVILT